MTKSAALDFLLADLDVSQRDAVSKAYFEFAGGDDGSYPVALSLLLTACARQIGQAPEAIRGTLGEQKDLLQAMVNAAAKLETTVDRSNTLSQVIEAHRNELKSLIETAVDRIDVEKVANKFESAFGDAMANQTTVTSTLNTATEALKSAASTSEEALKKFRTVQYGWIMAMSFLSSFLICAVIAICAVISFEADSEQRLADRLSQQQATVQQLFRAGKNMTVEKDAAGSIYLVVPDVTDAYVSQDRKGIIKLR